MTALRSWTMGLTLFFCLVTATQAQGPTQADIAAGRRLALRICANCHLAAPDQKQIPFLRPPALSFASIAIRPSATEAYLRQLLGSTHAKLGPSARMPNPQLVDYQVDEIVAYIISLKGKK
jgi:mono/diheme cytochrome c family protein